MVEDWAQTLRFGLNGHRHGTTFLHSQSSAPVRQSATQLKVEAQKEGTKMQPITCRVESLLLFVTGLVLFVGTP